MELMKRDTLPVWPGLEEAMLDVKVFGQQTGRERLIALSPEGDRLFDVRGDTTNVAIPEPFTFPGMLHGALLVHDHPIFAPLSIPDLRVATQHGLAGIMAVMPDGSWDLAKGLRWNRETVETLQDAEEFSKRVAQQIFQAADFRETEVWAAGNLAFLVATQGAGVLKGWQHSYSEEFWQRAGKWVPEIKQGTFRVAGFGMFPYGL